MAEVIVRAFPINASDSARATAEALIIALAEMIEAIVEIQATVLVFVSERILVKARFSKKYRRRILSNWHLAFVCILGA